MSEYKVKDIIKIIEAFAPLSLQAEYDNCGLKIGNYDDTVSGIMLTLDTNEEVVEQALKNNCNLIIEHHPSIFEPIKALDYRQPLHKALVKAIKYDISIYSAHTNIDFTSGGLNDTVAKKMGLNGVVCLNGNITSARIGELDEVFTLGEYAGRLKKIIKDENITTIGDENKPVKKVAVINGGGGGDRKLILELQEAGADIFVTSDIKYSVARFAKDSEYGIISIGHFESEQDFVAIIEKLLKDNKVGVKIMSAVCANPYNYRR